MAALSRFISRLGEKALPLYHLLRRTEHSVWTDAATARLVEIKTLLESNPVLATHQVLLYISATHKVVSAVLVVERDEEGHKFHSKNQYITYRRFLHHASPDTLKIGRASCRERV